MKAREKRKPRLESADLPSLSSQEPPGTRHQWMCFRNFLQTFSRLVETLTSGLRLSPASTLHEMLHKQRSLCDRLHLALRAFVLATPCTSVRYRSDDRGLYPRVQALIIVQKHYSVHGLAFWIIIIGFLRLISSGVAMESFMVLGYPSAGRYIV